MDPDEVALVVHLHHLKREGEEKGLREQETSKR